MAPMKFKIEFEMSVASLNGWPSAYDAIESVRAFLTEIPTDRGGVVVPGNLTVTGRRPLPGMR